MKYFLTAVFFFALAASAVAEEHNLLSGTLVHGGYGAPVVKFTNVNGRAAVLVGGQGQWIINHMVALGIGGYGMTPNQERLGTGPSRWMNNPDLAFSYGGLLVSFISESDQVAHPTIDLLIGGGSVDLVRHSESGDDYSDDSHALHDGIFVIEPSLNAEVNIVRFMRANIGVSYRFASGVSDFGFDSSDFSGLSATLALKFGKF
jgi:hypothetical protein